MTFFRRLSRYKSKSLSLLKLFLGHSFTSQFFCSQNELYYFFITLTTRDRHLFLDVQSQTFFKFKTHVFFRIRQLRNKLSQFPQLSLILSNCLTKLSQPKEFLSFLVLMEPSIKLFIELSNEHIPSNQCNCSSFKLSHQMATLLSINLVAILNLRLSLSSMSVRVLETLFSQKNFPLLHPLTQKKSHNPVIQLPLLIWTI